MPAAIPKKGIVRKDRLSEFLENFDALFLDGYGVLNVGSEPIDSAYALLNEAKNRGVETFLVTNGASKTAAKTLEKYRKIGFNFTKDQLITSRDAMSHALSHSDGQIKKLGIIDSFVDDFELPLASSLRLNPGHLREWMGVDAIAFLGSVEWNDDWQRALELALEAGKTVHVANPDVASPQNYGLGKEPGYWAFQAAQKTGKLESIIWYGKPHQPIFDLAFSKLKKSKSKKALSKDRIAMVGDTLHTDILGGQAFGLKSILVTGYGFFKNGGFDEAILSTGITPDFIVRTV